jgi:hypothetical protein
MVSYIGNDEGISSWGRRGEHRLYRITWRERPGMYAEVTGPADALEAFLKCRPEVLARLPWIEREPAGGGTGLTPQRIAEVWPVFTCPRCGRSSSHPQDLREGYCGACHDWTAPPTP